MNSIFYQKKRAVTVDFKGERTTSDAAIILLEAIERGSILITV